MRAFLLTASFLALTGCAPVPSETKDVAAVKQERVADADVGTPRRLRLLTTQQYINTMQHFFGPDIKIEVKFAPLARTDGLLVAGSSIAGVGSAQIEVYQKVASRVAAQVVAPERRDVLISCVPKSDKAADDKCASQFLRDVTRYLYRAPLPEDRLAVLTKDAGESANRLKDFYAGLQVTLEGVLISPRLLLLEEAEVADSKNPGEVRLDALSYASRLSLFLWNAAPDRMLLDAAARGQLDTEKGRARVVDAMLASPRLEDGVRAFFDDMFRFDAFETLTKDAATYPYFLGEAARDAREQTLRTVVDQLLTKNNDYRDIFTARETFLSRQLGVLYNVPTGPGWKAVEFPPEAHRDGILTHVSFLSLHSHATRTSPTLRGKALREILMCQPVPSPPANVDFSSLENPDPKIKTTRERVAFHLENPVCAGCHRITDPIGLALENFDGAGQYRTAERGAPIDGSGNLDGKDFSDVQGLSQAVRNHPAVPRCLVRRALTYATGGALPKAVEPALANLNTVFQQEQYRLRPLLRQIALSSAFSDVMSPGAATPQKTAAITSAEASTSNSN